MDIEQVKAILPFMQAYADGKTLEYKYEFNDKWGVVTDAKFDGAPSRYRIKPEPKYRPFKDAEECWQEMSKHQPFGWIYDGGYHYSIVSITDVTVNIINDIRDIIECLFSEMIEEGYTFADGTPFGVKVEQYGVLFL